MYRAVCYGYYSPSEGIFITFEMLLESYLQVNLTLPSHCSLFWTFNMDFFVHIPILNANSLLLLFLCHLFLYPSTFWSFFDLLNHCFSSKRTTNSIELTSTVQLYICICLLGFCFVRRWIFLIIQFCSFLIRFFCIYISRDPQIRNLEMQKQSEDGKYCVGALQSLISDGVDGFESPFFPQSTFERYFVLQTSCVEFPIYLVVTSTSEKASMIIFNYQTALKFAWGLLGQRIPYITSSSDQEVLYQSSNLDD